MRRAALVALTVALAACQGSIGSTPPVNAPGGGLQPNAYGQSAGAGFGASRAATTEASVRYGKDVPSIVFPSSQGYGLSIALNAAPSPSPSGKGKAAGGPTPSPTPGASSSPGLSPSAEPTPSPSASPTPTPKGHKAPTIALKLTVYPDLAPDAPTPDPDESPVPTPVPARSPLVRGFLRSPGDLTVPSLDSFRFSVPADEVDKSRGFSVALFEIPDKKEIAQSLLGSHKVPGRRMAFATAATIDSAGTIHTAVGGDSIQLLANRGYAVFLYGDQRAAAMPSTVPAAVGLPGSPGASPSALPPGVTPGPGQLNPGYPPGVNPPGAPGSMPVQQPYTTPVPPHI